MSEHTCGHSDEEHEADLEEATEIIMGGNLSPMFQAMPVDMLMLNVEVMIAELFVRAENDETFLAIIDKLAQGAHEVLVGNEDDEIRQHLLESRATYAKEVEDQQFEHEASAEIGQMLEEFGVIPEAAPPVEDDNWPGQYL